MHVGSRALPRRPIRVHAALAGRLAGRLADWRLAVVAVPADVSQWVSARGAAGRRARVCRHTDSKHGVCPRAHVWGPRRTRRRSSELGARDDSRDTAGRLRTARGFIRVCAKNHSRGMHAARGITVIARSKSKTWTEHGTLHRRDRVATRSKDSAPHRCATWCAMRRVGGGPRCGPSFVSHTEHQNESTRLDILSRLPPQSGMRGHGTQRIQPQNSHRQASARAYARYEVRSSLHATGTLERHNTCTQFQCGPNLPSHIGQSCQFSLNQPQLRHRLAPPSLWLARSLQRSFVTGPARHVLHMRKSPTPSLRFSALCCCMASKSACS